MARSNLLEPTLAYVHPKYRTPSLAILAVGVGTAFTKFLGEAVLVPILDVGALCCAIAWMAACITTYCMRPHWLVRAAAIFGILVTTLMVLVKVVPLVPGHFTRYEWIALAIWAGLGLLVSMPQHVRLRAEKGETDS